ncbi:putative membrane protein [Burkholderia cenocepacia]|uniref:Membrane protein n=1 Tax=Burkholderia cenocepacia TaxID=95486 RepID=A0AAN0RX60_9BURK|nr:putative membrane protein [Burkholderia cenocepacia]EGC98780.1 hypothetical protein B1M_39888 [Burkholderia sp. TJI49]
MPFRTVVIVAVAAVVLAGCVVVPARPAYYRPAPVVVY